MNLRVPVYVHVHVHVRVVVHAVHSVATVALDPDLHGHVIVHVQVPTSGDRIHSVSHTHIHTWIHTPQIRTSQ